MRHAAGAQPDYCAGPEKDRDRGIRAPPILNALKRLKRDLDYTCRRFEWNATSCVNASGPIHCRSHFENLSGMKEDEYLRDGITEDITTELSKIKG
jgi:non-specific serine/threonine protein kinase